jgi:hypothetical protein
MYEVVAGADHGQTAINDPEWLSYALTKQENDVHRDNLARRPVGTLDGPSKTITVEPIRVPVTAPPQPAVAPEPHPERSTPRPEKEPARA